MVEKMLLDYAKLHRQRALFVSTVLNLMAKEFEDDEVNIFKIALGNQIVDVLMKEDGEIMLNDEVESILLKSIKTFMEKESALLTIKNIIKGESL